MLLQPSSSLRRKPMASSLRAQYALVIATVLLMTDLGMASDPYSSNFTGHGPYNVVSWGGEFSCLPGKSEGRTFKQLDVYLPSAGPQGLDSHAARAVAGLSAVAGATTSDASGFPMVFFYHGFLCHLDWYENAYFRRLASWGFAVIAFDVTTKTIENGDWDTIQLTSDMIEWIRDLQASSRALGNNTDAHKSGGEQAQPEADGAATQCDKIPLDMGELPSDWPLHIDLSRSASVGHSRGGKLAALALTNLTDTFSTAYLIDPVDSIPNKVLELVQKFFSWTGIDLLAFSVSGVQAMKDAGSSLPRIGMAGAGEVGMCNGNDKNYQQFWKVVPEESWLTVVDGARHMQFASANESSGGSSGPELFRKALNFLCSIGQDKSTPDEVVLDLTMPGLTAWLVSFFEVGEGGQQPAAAAEDGPAAAAAVSAGRGPGSWLGSSLASFWRWVVAQQEAGKIEFYLKRSTTSHSLQEPLPALQAAA